MKSSKMDIGLSFAKYAVFLFNFLFAVLGIAMMTVGGMVLAKINPYGEFLENVSLYPILLIVVGVIVFLIAFLGCCGAIKENTCMLFMFSIILILIVIFEVGIVAGAYVKKDNMKDYVYKRLNYTMVNYDSKQVYREAWNLLQNELKCCGVDGPTDWDNLHLRVPSSCCGKASNGTCISANAYQNGCKTTFVEQLKGHLITVAGLAIGVAVVELLGIVFACCLYSAYRRGTAY